MRLSITGAALVVAKVCSRLKSEAMASGSSTSALACAMKAITMVSTVSRAAPMPSSG